MDSLAYYAVLGSLVAAAAGVLVVIAAAMRVVRLSGTVALLCFAVAAGLAIVAVMQQGRATGLAVAVRDGGDVLERVEALETRVARAELQPQAASGGAPEPGAGESHRADRASDRRHRGAGDVRGAACAETTCRAANRARIPPHRTCDRSAASASRAADTAPPHSGTVRRCSRHPRPP